MTLIRSFIKDSAVYGGADFVSRLVAFATFPVLAYHLKPSDFGELELVITATSLLGLVVNCGLNNAVQRFYWDPETKLEQQPQIVSSGLCALILNCLAALLLGALVSLAFVSFRTEPGPIGFTGLVSALVLMVASQVAQFLLDVTRLHFAPWRFFAVSVATKIMSSLAAVAAVAVIGWQLNGMLGLQAAIALAAVPLSIGAVRRDIVPVINWVLARRLLAYGYPFIFAGMAFWVMGAIDRWMLAGTASLAEVGIFSVANRLATVVMFVSAAFGLAWSPLAMKIRVDRPERYTEIYAEVLLVLFGAMTLLAGAISLFSGELISLFFPRDYHDASVPFVVLAMGVAFYATQQVTAVGISLAQKTHLFGRLAWQAAGLNVLLNLALIPLFSSAGAAAATAISWGFLSGMYLYHTQMLHPLPVNFRSFGILLGMWLALTCCSLLMNSQVFTIAGVISKSIILLSTAALSLFVIPTRALRDVA